MALQSLDPSVLYLFMGIGLVFTLSGLFFIFKRNVDENAARIELFGLKFH